MSPVLYKICMILVLIGAINWGLVALGDWNAVEWISNVSGESNKKNLAKLIYVIVAIAGMLLFLNLES